MDMDTIGAYLYKCSEAQTYAFLWSKYLGLHRACLFNQTGFQWGELPSISSVLVFHIFPKTWDLQIFRDKYLVNG